MYQCCIAFRMLEALISVNIFHRCGAFIETWTRHLMHSLPWGGSQRDDVTSLGNVQYLGDCHGMDTKYDLVRGITASARRVKWRC